MRLPRLRRHRPAKRRPGGRLRFPPPHLALDGHLVPHLGGPAVAWEEWSRQALRDGLSPRAEDAYLGWPVRGPGDALRAFEIHPGQCGVMVYAADTLAASFAVPHEDDYRLPHPSLIQDLYGSRCTSTRCTGAADPGGRLRLAAPGPRTARGPGTGSRMTPETNEGNLGNTGFTLGQRTGNRLLRSFAA